MLKRLISRRKVQLVVQVRLDEDHSRLAHGELRPQQLVFLKEHQPFFKIDRRLPILCSRGDLLFALALALPLPFLAFLAFVCRSAGRRSVAICQGGRILERVQ